MSGGNNEPRNPRVVLEADHERINAHLDLLIAAMRAEDRATSLSLWPGAETQILAHLDVEEMFVFPLLAESNAVEVEALRHQHDEIRGTLGALGIAFELPALPIERVATFTAFLRAHEEREESLLYPQAERRMPANAARFIAKHLWRKRCASGETAAAPRGQGDRKKAGEVAT